MLGGVYPVTATLLLLGYALALPIGMKLPQVVAQQNRLAMIGHQLGVVIAGIGWLLKESVALAVVHVIWLAGARLWFYSVGRSQARPT